MVGRRPGQEAALINRCSRHGPLLALLVLFPALWSCSSGGGGEDALDTDPLNNGSPPAHDVDIVPGAADAGANAFSPSNAVISLSTKNTVTWYNADFTYAGGSGEGHLLKSNDGTTFESGTIPPDGVFQATFTAPGVYNYHCEIHDEMKGTVTVNP